MLSTSIINEVIKNTEERINETEELERTRISMSGLKEKTLD
jgi:hypothetical protein